MANGKVTTQPPFQEGSVQAAVGDADLPDEAALLDQVSAAMKAILRPRSSTTQTNPSSAPRQAKPAPSAHQALDCFLRTRMDVLVLERVLVRRQAA